MGSQITQNALKGYHYQQWVYEQLVYKMDLERNLFCLNVEIKDNKDIKNFDDIKVTDSNKKEYYIQVKNYKNFNINSVSINDNKIKINNDFVNFNENLNNILILNSEFETNSEILGMKAKFIKPIYFIPLTKTNINLQIGNYFDTKRKEDICKLVHNNLNEAKFKLNLNELPELYVYSTKLNKKTVLLRNVPNSENIKKEVTWYIGEPGIGKSHLVSEFEENFDNILLYRFHIDNLDKYKTERLYYKHFLKDLSYKLFNNSSLYDEKTILKKLSETDIILILDGLDHIENYNPNEFKRYIEFIEKIYKTKTLIFSRPLHSYNNYNNIIYIKKWSKEETKHYLIEEYDFKDEIDIIYDTTEGYPIITYYLAEHLKNGGSIKDYPKPIKSINEYYDNILKNVKTKSSMRIFLTIPSYILEKEFSKLLDDNLSEIVLEFINEYSFLFNKKLNRISLFHDSLNNYLLNHMKPNKNSLKIIKQSILSLNIEYLARFNSIQFDDDFIINVLKLYCNFDTFNKIFRNFDFESIKIFYLNLKKVIPKYEDALNIYQYYSFILITMLLERNDYHHSGKLFYNIFNYADKHKIDENNIYSNGVLWSLYVFYKTKDIELYNTLLEKEVYNKEQVIKELKDEWIKEYEWSPQKIINLPSEKKIRDYIIKTHDNKLFENYLAYIYINNIKKSEYYILIKNYVENTFKEHHEKYYNEICIELRLSNYYQNNLLKNAKLKIYEYGYLEKENIFLQNNLKQFMEKQNNNYSCNIYPLLVSYIRLHNYKNENYEFEEIFKFLNMYYFRKDYSFLNLTVALLTFEKHNCINENISLQIIQKSMLKSEKGIRHLLTEYLNNKSEEFILKIKDQIKYMEIDIRQLNSNIINMLDFETFQNRIQYILYPSINYTEIENILKSKFSKILINKLNNSNILINNVPNENTTIFEENHINYNILEETEFISLENREYLNKTDLNYVNCHNISHLELSKYLDDYNHCLPYIKLFENYGKDILKKDCLKIIHNAISTKENYFNEYPSKWYLCLGNIPFLLDLVNYELDWNKLFYIFKQFLKHSSILPL